ncbi:MAG: hypothetical protein IKF16_10240 [Lachnospiraceae bacterium]|nr:hypothetical protein [Lachnospiraceae bacterium]
MNSEDKVRKVAIIGIGIQGSMLAFRNSFHGKMVCGYSRTEKSGEICRQKIHQWAEYYMEQGKLTAAGKEELLGRITYASSLEKCVEDADLVIECVPEKLALKQELFGQLDKVCPEKTLFSSNTSSLLMSEICVHCSEARKKLSFQSDHDDPVRNNHVELMWNVYTSEETKAAAMAHYHTLGFDPIVTEKEVKGYSINRVWRAVKRECLWLWANGYCTPGEFDRGWKEEWESKVGPFELMDLIGLDTIYNIEMSYFEASGEERDRPPKALKEMVDNGILGMKSGSGFYKGYNTLAGNLDAGEKKKEAD